MSNLHKHVVETIVLWALNLQKPEGRSRVNLKLLFGDTTIARAVRDALHVRNDDRCAYVVRGSTDTDAVRLRNERPAGLGPGAGLIYIVFWLPGQPGHERNFESLRDFRSVTLAAMSIRSRRAAAARVGWVATLVLAAPPCVAKVPLLRKA